jgi:imidazolonepropionase-like amidohydrolase
MTEVLGYSPERGLVAATSDAASAIGLGDTLGRLSPGYSADLLVMKGRPWERVKDLSTDNLLAVVCRGELVHGELPVGRAAGFR